MGVDPSAVAARGSAPFSSRNTTVHLLDQAAPTLREHIRINYGSLIEIKSLLAAVAPDARYSVDFSSNSLVMEGSPPALAQVRELLEQLDRPNGAMFLDAELVDLSELGIRSLRPLNSVLLEGSGHRTGQKIVMMITPHILR